MQQAMTERRHLIETRAEAVLDTALHTHEPWVTALGPIPASGRDRQQWRRRAVVIAAYRDRYQITDSTPLGAQPESTAQKIDRARARVAAERAQAVVPSRRFSTAPRSVAVERKPVGPTMWSASPVGLDVA